MGLEIAKIAPRLSKLASRTRLHCQNWKDQQIAWLHVDRRAQSEKTRGFLCKMHRRSVVPVVSE